MYRSLRPRTCQSYFVPIIPSQTVHHAVRPRPGGPFDATTRVSRLLHAVVSHPNVTARSRGGTRSFRVPCCVLCEEILTLRVFSSSLPSSIPSCARSGLGCSRLPADGVPRNRHRTTPQRQLAGPEGPHAEGGRAHLHRRGELTERAARCH